MTRCNSNLFFFWNKKNKKKKKHHSCGASAWQHKPRAPAYLLPQNGALPRPMQGMLLENPPSISFPQLHLLLLQNENKRLALCESLEGATGRALSALYYHRLEEWAANAETRVWTVVCSPSHPTPHPRPPSQQMLERELAHIRSEAETLERILAQPVLSEEELRRAVIEADVEIMHIEEVWCSLHSYFSSHVFLVHSRRDPFLSHINLGSPPIY